MSKTVEMELDDLTYVLEYVWQRPRPATRHEPAEGGVEIVRILALLNGSNGAVEVDVTEHTDSLEVTRWLVERAYKQEREAA